MSHLSLVPATRPPRQLVCRSSIALEVETLGLVEVAFGDDHFFLPVGTELEVDCRAEVTMTDRAVDVAAGFASWECPRCGAVNHVDLGEETA